MTKVDVQTRTPDDLLAELGRFEIRFGVPSDRLADAFRVAGKLIETEDFHRWSSLYAFWRAATKSAKRGRR